MRVPGKGGRPRKYSEEMAAEICERLAAGEALIKITRDPHLPFHSTVYSWVIDDLEGFASRYARAREIQAEMIAEEIESISDDESKDITIKLNKKYLNATLTPHSMHTFQLK